VQRQLILIKKKKGTFNKTIAGDEEEKDRLDDARKSNFLLNKHVETRAVKFASQKKKMETTLVSIAEEIERNKITLEKSNKEE